MTTLPLRLKRSLSSVAWGTGTIVTVFVGLGGVGYVYEVQLMLGIKVEDDQKRKQRGWRGSSTASQKD
jgi:hypothetical protein